jgi:putative hydroxymethylpyrimidine transport system permease protein
VRLARALATAGGLLLLWQAAVTLADLPPYLLPAPLAVLGVWIERADTIAAHAIVTALEMVAGFGLGAALGIASALAVASFRPVRRWLMPLLVVSQAIPVFAIAPLLVLWFGYGMASKVAMAALIIFFPVAANFLDGLRRTEPGWLDLARTMTVGRPGAALRILWHIRVPAALPALASGLRVAAAVAPIGAVVGEWVGSSAGLGFLMLHANARLQIDLMFAALLTLALFALVLYFTVDRGLTALIAWQRETLPSDGATVSLAAPGGTR